MDDCSAPGFELSRARHRPGHRLSRAALAAGHDVDVWRRSHFGAVGHRQRRPKNSGHGHCATPADQGFLSDVKFYDWRDRCRKRGRLFHARRHRYFCSCACCAWCSGWRDSRRADAYARVQYQYSAALRGSARFICGTDAAAGFRYPLFTRIAVNRTIHKVAQLECLLAGTPDHGALMASVVACGGLGLAMIDSRFGAPRLAISRDMRIATIGIALFILLPVARVIVMLVAYFRQRDYRLSAIALLVLMVILLGFVVGVASRRG